MRILLKSEAGLSRPARTADPGRRGTGTPGFSVVELMITVVIAGVVSGAAFTTLTNTFPLRRADAALQFLQARLLQARAEALDQRRSFRVTFKGTHELLIERIELSGPATTVADYFLPHGATYTYFATLPDTPDAFGHTQAVSFNGGNAILFASDGTMTDGSGAFCNGTVFIAVNNITATSRALTVMGATSRIKAYKFDDGTAHYY